VSGTAEKNMVKMKRVEREGEKGRKSQERR
jgi:hypothetical protein